MRRGGAWAALTLVAILISTASVVFVVDCSNGDPQLRCSRTCVAENCSSVGIRYGKYCGVGWSGCQGEKPCDDLDACCQVHDDCVEKKGMTNIKCHEKFKTCIKKVQKSGKVGFSRDCPYQTAVPTMVQGMDMAILLSQFDINKEAYEFGLPIIQKAGVEHKIDFIHSSDLHKENEGCFEFSYVDADEDNYLNYRGRPVKLVKIGGLLVYEDVLWGGFVAMPLETIPERKRPRLHGIQQDNSSRPSSRHLYHPGWRQGHDMSPNSKIQSFLCSSTVAQDSQNLLLLSTLVRLRIMDGVTILLMLKELMRRPFM